MFKETGIATKEQVLEKFPNLEILTKPKAIIECYQNIPCNPCETSCPFGALTIGDNINNIPQIDYEICTGCGVCVYSCPGQAIMIAQIKAESVQFKISYEMLPFPKKGDIWNGINRHGEIICKAKIEGVLNNKSTDRTTIITVKVPQEYLYDFRTVRPQDE